MSRFDEQGCGCCGGTTHTSGCQIRPALPVIPYRFADYPRFVQAMLVSAAADSKLDGWTSRSPNDFGMQILGMWAHLGDILTFYQERIANEAYLRTATQRENVRRLAAALDYRLGPGAAAVVFLAFTLDKDKTLTVQVGLRVQSVPEQNQKPQKFETVEEVQMDARWNQVHVFPAPIAFEPFAQGQSFATLLNEAQHVPPLAPSTRVIVFSDSAIENKEIASLHKTIAGTILKWTAPIQQQFLPKFLFTFLPSKPEARVYRRQFRLFGSQAPTQFTEAVPNASAPGGIRWQIRSPSFLVPANSTVLPLEMIVEDLKPGTEMLLVHTHPSQGFVRNGVVVKTAPATKTLGAVHGTVTEVTLKFSQAPPPGVKEVDLRLVTLYELTGPPLQLAKTNYPDTIRGSQVFVPLPALSEIPRKRTIILDDGAPDPHVATVDVAMVSGSHLAITFTPALPRSFSTATCVLLGNVAKATHGESVKNEVLGNGDAALRLQKFVLRKNPVTFVPLPGAPNGVADTLEVRVDGLLWEETPSLLGTATDARVYTTSVAEEGKVTVQFGGESGARLPSGRNNIVATYRHGLGPDGNVRSKGITTLLDRPAGLKSVANPTPASGGAAQEPIETARVNAPNTVKTFGRIVSLADFENAARELATVAKAKVALSWTGQEQEVSVAVAGEGGAVLSSTLLRDVLADLNSRRDVNRKMTVRSHNSVPVVIAVRVQVDKAFLLEDVEVAVRTALLKLFRFDLRDLGEPAFQSDIFRVIQAVPSVVAADLDVFRYKNPSGPDLREVLPAQWFEILALDTADLALMMQFGSL